MLKRGDTGALVTRLQQRLVGEGLLVMPKGSTFGVFGRLTESAVVYFQQTHLGPTGQPLLVDGVVGPATWWALEHASGEPQRSHLDARIPHRLTEQRVAVLETALRYHAMDIREQPNGSNRGPLIDRFLPAYWHSRTPGPPWCAFSAHAIAHEATGRYPLGRHLGSCYRTAVLASDAGLWRVNPLPADLFVMLYRDSEGVWSQRGHMGIVLRVDDLSINTLEGNAGNRFKLGVRRRQTITGYVNWYGEAEQPLDFERGTVTAPPLGASSTR